MPAPNKTYWITICFINLLIVSVLGVVMRYKIGFEFPYFNQKNIQHAHSHFAFNGWISLLLMVLMVLSQYHHLSEKSRRYFHILFLSALITAYGMLLSFAVQGYGLCSIFFSTVSILISFAFCRQFFLDTKQYPKDGGLLWMYAGMVFNVLSAAGTFYLSYMMASRHLEQHKYLSSVYWFLHFQYNGWFFFSCMGLLVYYVKSKGFILANHDTIFWLFAASCIPAYGLSVLWFNLPIWIYSIVVAAAITQFVGLILLTRSLIGSKISHALDGLGKALFLFFMIALIIKVSLQLGSTIPAISKFAFGFRPIVIAYLHLVLLAFTTVFLITNVYVNQLLEFKQASKFGIIIFICGIFLNEVLLAIQGIASLSYTVIPYANQALFGIALMILLGLILLNTSKSLK